MYLIWKKSEKLLSAWCLSICWQRIIILVDIKYGTNHWKSMRVTPTSHHPDVQHSGFWSWENSFIFCRELSYVSVALPHHSTQGLTALCFCKDATPLLQHPQKKIEKKCKKMRITYKIIIAKLINFLLIDRADLFWCTFLSIHILNR